MIAEIQNVINEFVMMWVLIDPIGTIPVFLVATAGMKPERRRLIATRATVIAGLILTFFLIGGHLLLRLLGIPLPSFQIAGGIVLFLFALTMIFGPPKAEQEKQEVETTVEQARSIAVFPLAIPSIASPGAMLGVVLLNDTEKLTAVDTLVNLGVIFVILGITLVFMYSAKPILAMIGDGGVNVLGRIMGLILAAVAADNVLVAIAQFFGIGGTPPSPI